MFDFEEVGIARWDQGISAWVYVFRVQYPDALIDFTMSVGVPDMQPISSRDDEARRVMKNLIAKMDADVQSF